MLGEAAGGTSSLKKDLVLYDGAKSHLAHYNFCYLCKERLDTYHDDADENWYFLDTKQVRFKQSSASSAAKKTEMQSTGGVFNVHTNCLKEIEELNFTGSTSATSALPASDGKKAALATEKMEVPVSIVGSKRTYVDAQAKGSTILSAAGGKLGDEMTGVDQHTQAPEAVVDLQLRGLQAIISGLESQKRRRVK